MTMPPPSPAPMPAGAHGAVSWQGLRQVTVLKALPDERLAQLAAHCRWQRLAPPQTLDGAYVDRRLYLLVQGSLRVSSYGHNGRGLTLGEIAQGEFFGGWPLLAGATPIRLEVAAGQPSLVASLAHEDVEALLMGEPAVLRAVIERLSDLAKGLAMRMIDLGTLPVRSRLHARLLELAARAGPAGNQAVIVPAPRQSDLALLLGTSREEVVREMSRLARLGLLQREGKNLRLCNIEGLRQLLEEAR